MNELWAAILGGLIGSVIGGVFTAAAAVLQVRGTLQAARIQAELAYSHSLQARERERLVEAARECLDINHAVWTALAAAIDLHRSHPAGSAACRDELPTEVDSAARALRRFTYITKHDLPREAQGLVSVLDDQVDLIISGTEPQLRDALQGRDGRCLSGEAVDQAIETSEILETAVIQHLRAGTATQ